MPLFVAVLATCLVASSNYVSTSCSTDRNDLLHPEKAASPRSVRSRPPRAGVRRVAAAGGRRLRAGAVAELYFFASAVWLWVMGIAYNVPPLRTKEWPYLDVLSESVNNPIRLLLGWFALVDRPFPPVSLADVRTGWSARSSWR